ncbi:transcriptional regulator, LysR family [Kribbella flavida DSM 17836]|uniref:Transcriptional regulator, LysR family n=1 Tax=Kribbella flavida (strain DSM 17836 / JCM 10339 / NBRC 14399) TaxID=479435 RepID=D2PXG9_KRIFD|nr:LysR substrate-binding domain-containing protein [Kribbella flavida]ADB29817.1 transcriptional regulator, LysR family [Kribbella flavida DSM 17836]
MDVDLRLVRYFLVMAEELHFTAAARRLYVSQPALSNQIRRLENQLGAQLFERSPRGVTMTAAGDAFLPHAQSALAAIRSGVAEATAAAGRDQVLRIDVLQTDLVTPRAVLARLRDRLPALRLEVSSRGSREQEQRLLSGELDLALCGSTARLADGLVQRVIRREALGIALPAGHPLTTADAVAVRELADEVHYLPRDDFAPEWNEFVLSCFRTAGFQPRRHPASTDGTSSALELVRAGECVALGLLSTPAPDGVVVKPLAAGVPPYTWTLRWRESAHPPTAALAVLRSLD